MKPANMTHEEAAAVLYGAIMATSLLRSAENGVRQSPGRGPGHRLRQAGFPQI